MTTPANMAAPTAKLVTITPLSIIPKIPPGADSEGHKPIEAWLSNRDPVFAFTDNPL
jgi:hypothetical protein